MKCMENVKWCLMTGWWSRHNVSYKDSSIQPLQFNLVIPFLDCWSIITYPSTLGSMEILWKIFDLEIQNIWCPHHGSGSVSGRAGGLRAAQWELHRPVLGNTKNRQSESDTPPAPLHTTHHLHQPHQLLVAVAGHRGGPDLMVAPGQGGAAPCGCSCGCCGVRSCNYNCWPRPPQPPAELRRAWRPTLLGASLRGPLALAQSAPESHHIHIGTEQQQLGQSAAAGAENPILSNHRGVEQRPRRQPGHESRSATRRPRVKQSQLSAAF